MPVEKIKRTAVKEKDLIWNGSCTQNHHVPVRLIVILSASDLSFYIWATTEAAFTVERGNIQKKQICLMRYIFGTNFSVKLRRKWLCLVAPPEGTVALSSIILAFIFIVKQSWKQIKWAERTQKKGASLPVKNGTHSKPERVVSVGFLCFILLNFSLIAAWTQQHFKSYDSTKPIILLSTLCHLILVQYKWVCAVVCSVLLYVDLV